MLRSVARWIERLKQIDYEQAELGRQIMQVAQQRNQPVLRILDIGCGHGRNLKFLKALGHEVVGVDVNPEIVAENCRVGLPTLTVEAGRDVSEKFDVLLCSHVIEHFAPKELLEFLNGWLDKLPIGGCLIVLTPLLSPYFYVDFDHVKPYLPEGILMVFGEEFAQVQYSSRHRLRLVDVWFRKNWLSPRHVRSRYMKTPWGQVFKAFEAFGVLAFTLSNGWIGRVDGWLGTFEKV